MALLTTSVLAVSTLLGGFRNPPQEARPQTWWHWMNGNVSREGIVADLDAMAAIGLGGVTIFDAGCDVPEGPLRFGTEEWFDTVRFAAHEAHQRGLEVILSNCSGWSSSGGPWIAPSNSMMFVEFGSVDVTGPGRREVKLPPMRSKGGYAKDIAVLAIPEDGARRKIADLDFKTLRHRYYHADEKREKIPEGTVVRREDIRDLTSGRQGDRVVFDVPPGKWRIFRFYFAANGQRNRAASAAGRGLECDKLRKGPAQRHFDAYVGRLAKDIDGVLVDSYEVGCQNWTDGFECDFKSRRGYDLTPYLPVFAGCTVGDDAETERFLADLRQTVRELFDESYIPVLAERCHANGLKLHLEPYGNGPCENFAWGREADVPMCEFRFSPTELITGFAAEVAEAARRNGRRIVAAEAYTARPKDGRWLETPFALKPSTDRVYALGVNRIVYHRFAHQPWVGPTRYPGMTLGYWGTHFERTQTWWNDAKPFVAYQGRCQWMLQQGDFVGRGERDGIWRIHRRQDGRDWYFLSATNRTELTVRLSDHCADGRPAQIWDPEDGRIYDCPDGLLTLRPKGSAFVVYGSDERPEPRPSREFEPVAALAGDWQVEFPTNWYSGGNDVRTVETGLVDWTTFREDELKFFSGTATYRKTVTLPRAQAAGGRLFLDLGAVREFAEVTVNGRTYPSLWRPPYRVDITDSADAKLDVVIRVTNLWPNRLIGDERTRAADGSYASNGRLDEIPAFVREGKTSPTGRQTFAAWRHWKAGDALRPSGLTGPVRLLRSASEEGPVARTFADPPRTYRPWAYWWWLNGHVDRPQMTADLEDVRRLGFGGVLMFDSRGYWDDDQHCRMEPADIDFMSERWFDNVAFGLKECDRLGLEFTMNASSSGGSLKGFRNGSFYEVDITKPTQVTAHLDRVLGPILKRVPGLVGKTFTHLYSVSWEGTVPGLDLNALPGASDEERYVCRNRLISEGFYGTMKRWAGDHGLGLYSESGGPWSNVGGVRQPDKFLFADQLAFLSWNDMPQGEFWFNDRHPENRHFHLRGAVAAGHAKGCRRISAEAFTHMRFHWSVDPFRLKDVADQAFADGVNHLVWHTYTSSPARYGTPGGEYFAGSHINRNVTWNSELRPFVDYLARCQYLLQLGRPVVDFTLGAGACPYQGWGHFRDVPWEGSSVRLPRGYTYDIVNGPMGEMTPKNLPEPDCLGPFAFQHRIAGDADIYFLVGEGAADVSFRVTGKRAELWDAVTGEVIPVAVRESDGRSVVSVSLPKFGSVFVVFSPKALQPVKASGEKRDLAVTGPWTVSFAYHRLKHVRHLPQARTLDRLVDWTASDDDDLRHFSGIATYRTVLPLALSNDVATCRLSLGALPSGVARVRINGTDCGIVWCAPWTVEIPKGTLLSGDNEIEIRYVNNWRNRLIGDCFLEPSDRVTRSCLRMVKGPRTSDLWDCSGYCTQDALQPSGLLGPVRMFLESRRKGE